MLTSRINLTKVISIFEKLSCYSSCHLVRKDNFHPVFSKQSYDHMSSHRFHHVSIRACSTEAKSISQSNSSVKSEHNYNDELLKDINHEEIVGKDEALFKKLKVLLLEIDIMRQDGFGIPDKISVERWKELLQAPTRSQRVKLLSFLFRVQKKKERELIKKEERKKLIQVRKEDQIKLREENPHIHYGFSGSTIFLRVYDTKIDALLNSKLITSMMFGQNLVLDCSYDKYMTPKEASLCAKQMMILFSENRKHNDPFNLHFCNATKDMKHMTKLNALIPTLYDDEFPLNITDKSYLDIFPKEKLVYLTPHCRDELETYSHDDIYIIGGMVDKVSNEQLSLGIAKRQGLRMAKFPLDRHLLWHIGTKSLTLNQVLSILLEMKSSGDWSKAFQHVPKRKILREDEINSKPTKGPSLYRQRLKQFHRF